MRKGDVVKEEDYFKARYEEAKLGVVHKPNGKMKLKQELLKDSHELRECIIHREYKKARFIAMDMWSKLRRITE
jgi:hypothetical protein